MSGLPAIPSESPEMAVREAASAGFGMSAIRVVLHPDYSLVWGTHATYAALGEWAWVGRETQ